MDFKLDIGELTNTIRDYENFIRILAEQKENINKTVKELTDLGWSGAAKDQFEQNHSKKQEFYTTVEENFKYVENAMEREEKPEAVKLKKRCEGFEDCIKRSAGGVALTNDDTGVISLQYSGQALINNNVDECINNHYKKMDSKFVEIQNLVNSLTFTSFPIGEDIEKARKSLKDQTTSLTDFNDSFNEYCSGVKTMESNICSIFGKISGITEGISKFRGISVISEGGQVDKNKVMQLMIKNPDNLTEEEKEALLYVEKVLGEEKYAELKQQVFDLNFIADKDLRERVKYLIREINSMSDNEKVDEGRWGFSLLYSKQDYIDELSRVMSVVQSPYYQKTTAFQKRVNLGADGACEFIGGVTEVPFGWAVATGGSFLTEGTFAPLAVPVGGYLMADGTNSMFEGLTKVKNAAVNPNGDATNFLKDKYKEYLGPEKGEMVYNGASMVTAGLCLTNDFKTLEPTMVKEETIEIPRKRNIAKAFKENLPTETIVTRQASQTVQTTQTIDENNPTPMILKRVIVKDPTFNVKNFDPNKAGKFDFMSTVIDMRNTFNENGTVNSWTDSADTYIKSNPDLAKVYGGNNEK
jgi:hypothetical protein